MGQLGIPWGNEKLQGIIGDSFGKRLYLQGTIGDSLGKWGTPGDNLGFLGGNGELQGTFRHPTPLLDMCIFRQAEQLFLVEISLRDFFIRSVVTK